MKTKFGLDPLKYCQIKQIHRLAEPLRVRNGDCEMVSPETGQNKEGEIVGLTAEIVSAYVGNNAIQSNELPDLIRTVFSSLRKLDGAEEEGGELRPAVSVRKSVTDEYIVCLEDGKKFKSLKRHLRAKYNMTPEEYREKWNLPFDYPMVAPAYARQRSHLAKKMGLGQAKK